MEEKTTLREDVDKLKKIFGEIEKKEKKPKKFKIPRKAKVNKRNAKKNYVTVVKLNENRNIDFEKKQIDEQTITVDGIPRTATVDCIGFYKKNPIMFIYGSSLNPVSFTELKEETDKNKTNATGMKLLLNKIELGGVKEKKKLSIKVILLLLVIIIVVGYLLLS